MRRECRACGGGIGGVLFDQRELLFKAAEPAKFVRAHPRFDHRAAPGRSDEADRNIFRTLKIATEEITDRREIRDALGGCDCPRVGPREPCLRRLADHLGDVEETDIGIARFAQHRECVGRVARLKLHVGLAGAQIDIADHHVGNRLRRRAAARAQSVGAAGIARRQSGAPVAARIRRDAACRAPQCDADPRARRRIAPHLDRRAALKHGMVLKHGVQKRARRFLRRRRAAKRKHDRARRDPSSEPTHIVSPTPKRPRPRDQPPLVRQDTIPESRDGRKWSGRSC